MKPGGYLRLDFRKQISFQYVTMTLKTQRVLNGEIQQFGFKKLQQHKGNFAQSFKMYRAHVFCRSIRLLAVDSCSVPLEMSKSSLSAYKCRGETANLRTLAPDKVAETQ